MADLLSPAPQPGPDRDPQHQPNSALRPQPTSLTATAAGTAQRGRSPSAAASPSAAHPHAQVSPYGDDLLEVLDGPAYDDTPDDPVPPPPDLLEVLDGPASDDGPDDHVPPPPDLLEIRDEPNDPAPHDAPTLPGLARGHGPRRHGPRGRRLVAPQATNPPPLTPQQRLLLLDTWQRSGLPAADFAALVGLSKHSSSQ